MIGIARRFGRKTTCQKGRVGFNAFGDQIELLKERQQAGTEYKADVLNTSTLTKTIVVVHFRMAQARKAI